MKNNVIMWQESDAFERAKLIDAIKSATAPVREAIKSFEWEGEFLTCAGDCNKEHWRTVYMYLSGYGDCQYQETSKPRQQPVARPVGPPIKLDGESMTAQGLINLLQDLIKHGANPDAVVKAYNGDDKALAPITGLLHDQGEIEICTDEL